MKKPVRIKSRPVFKEAMQFDGSMQSAIDIETWSAGKTQLRYVQGDVFLEGLRIDTLEGSMLGDAGDWVIRGLHGEYYFCKPDIFEKTYEVVEE